MTLSIDQAVSGADLAALIVAEAERRDMTPDELASALSRWPGKWLYQLRIAARPKPTTIERVRALLAGEHVPAPPPNNFQSVGAADSYSPPTGSWSLRPSEAKLPPRVERDPCPRCGVRGDIGCRHHRSWTGKEVARAWP